MKKRSVPLGALAAHASMVVAVFVARDAHATSYYVGPPGTGSDRNAGTQAQPFATIGQAARTAQAGDTIFIHGGVYSESVVPGHAGTATAWITFQAAPGELPILDGNGAGGTGFSAGGTGFIRVVGLASRRWSSSGFDNGWTNSVGNVQIIDCIADNNGINGIAFYKATGVLIQNSLVVHNGNELPSWSSGVNLFTAGGTYQDNQVIGNVSFENVDISTTHSTPTGHPTDGSGFILDQNSTGALFENNLGFRNGGSCIRLTNSSGAHLVNNTCYHDALDPGDGTPSNPSEIYFSDATTSTTGVVAANNLLVGGANNIGINHTTGSGSTFVKNVSLNGGGAATMFVNPGAASFALAAGASTVTDQGDATSAPSTDIGFDPRCITQTSAPVVGQAISWWGYWLDYAYIASVGGVAGCFHPAVRPQGAGPDVGAYEFGGQLSDAGAGGATGPGASSSGSSSGSVGSSSSSGGISSGSSSSSGGAAGGPQDAGAASSGSSGGQATGSSSGSSGVAGAGSSSGSSSGASGSGGAVPADGGGSSAGVQGGGDDATGCTVSRRSRGGLRDSSPWLVVGLGLLVAGARLRRRMRAR
jgi:hypothetical protein